MKALRISKQPTTRVNFLKNRDNVKRDLSIHPDRAMILDIDDSSYYIVLAYEHDIPDIKYIVNFHYMHTVTIDVLEYEFSN